MEEVLADFDSPSGVALLAFLTRNPSCRWDATRGSSRESGNGVLNATTSTR